MKYAAKKIYLTCGNDVLARWVEFMRENIQEVALSLADENVRHEMWFSGRDSDGLFIIGVMDVDDASRSAKIANASTLAVDNVHREFKKHWDRSRISDLDVSPHGAPTFEGCDLLFEARSAG